MDIKEIEEWWNEKPEVDYLLKRPIFGQWEDVTNWLIQRVKELEKSLTIKILENAKGAQVLFDVEARVKELEAKLAKIKSYPNIL